MRWLDDAPCVLMNEVAFDRDAGRLALSGPAGWERLEGVVGTLGGGTVASFGRALFHLPGPMKLVSAGVMLAGAGLAAVGGAKVLARCELELERDAGVRYRWRVLGTSWKERRVATADVVAVLVEREKFRVGHVRRGADVGRTDEPVQLRWELALRLRDGRRWALESHHTEHDAQARQWQVSQVLGVS